MFNQALYFLGLRFRVRCLIKLLFVSLKLFRLLSDCALFVLDILLQSRHLFANLVIQLAKFLSFLLIRSHVLQLLFNTLDFLQQLLDPTTSIISHKYLTFFVFNILLVLYISSLSCLFFLSSVSTFSLSITN